MFVSLSVFHLVMLYILGNLDFNFQLSFEFILIVINHVFSIKELLLAVLGFFF